MYSNSVVFQTDNRELHAKAVTVTHLGATQVTEISTAAVTAADEQEGLALNLRATQEAQTWCAS